ITGIERIDALTSTGEQTIVLNYNDILRITDNKNTLLINLGRDDRLTLTNMSGMTKVLDDVDLNDGVEGSTDMKGYDVFTDGNVTLLIHNGDNAIVTMDGTNVAI